MLILLELDVSLNLLYVIIGFCVVVGNGGGDGVRCGGGAGSGVGDSSR